MKKMCLALLIAISLFCTLNIFNANYCEAKEQELTGKIIFIHDKLNFVIINLGKINGVYENMLFDIVRDNTRIGVLKTIKVRDKISACDIEEIGFDDELRIYDTVIGQAKKAVKISTKKENSAVEKTASVTNEAATQLKKEKSAYEQQLSDIQKQMKALNKRLNSLEKQKKRLENDLAEEKQISELRKLDVLKQAEDFKAKLALKEEESEDMIIAVEREKQIAENKEKQARQKVEELRTKLEQEKREKTKILRSLKKERELLTARLEAVNRTLGISTSKYKDKTLIRYERKKKGRRFSSQKRREVKNALEDLSKSVIDKKQGIEKVSFSKKSTSIITEIKKAKKDVIFTTTRQILREYGFTITGSNRRRGTLIATKDAGVGFLKSVFSVFGSTLKRKIMLSININQKDDVNQLMVHISTGIKKGERFKKEEVDKKIYAEVEEIVLLIKDRTAKVN